DERELPVEMDQDRESADNRKRLLDQVAADTRQSGLRHPSVIGDSGDQVSGTFAVKELERLLKDVGIKLAADISQHAQSDPCHIIAVQIVAQTTQHEDERDKGANDKDGVDPGARAVHSIAQHVDFVFTLRKNLRVHMVQNQRQKSRDQSKKRAENQS